MRVTNKMMALTVLNNLGSNLNRLQKLQDQMSSGQIIAKPSDDPVIGARVMTMNSVLKQHDQYERNTNDALSWMEATEKALGSLTDVLQRVRELTVAGANGTLSPTDRDALAKEVEQLTGNVTQIANTSFANRYIFAGTITTAAPFDANGIYSGNSGTDGQMNWEVSQGVTITVNIDGSDAFNPLIAGVPPGDPMATPPVSHSIFSVLNSIKDSLQTGDTAQLSSTALAQLDSALDHVLKLRSDVGAKSNRLEMAQNRYAQETINYKALLSKLNDVDLAKLVTEIKMEENVYQAALSTGARIIQPSLVEFLR